MACAVTKTFLSCGVRRASPRACVTCGRRSSWRRVTARYACYVRNKGCGTLFEIVSIPRFTVEFLSLSRQRANSSLEIIAWISHSICAWEDTDWPRRSAWRCLYWCMGDSMEAGVASASEHGFTRFHAIQWFNPRYRKGRYD